MNNQLQVIKSAFTDKKRRTQNLILLVVLLVLLLVACNYIFKSNTPKSNSTSTSENIVSSESKKDSNSALEEKLNVVLSQIQGISDVSVVLSYSQEEKQNVVYNTKEETSEGRNTTEKVVAYNEQSGSKTAIVESIETPKVEGAIVVAKGADSVEIRSKIASAISSLVSIPAYKIQVFEKQS